LLLRVAALAQVELTRVEVVVLVVIGGLQDNLYRLQQITLSQSAQVLHHHQRTS